MVEDEASDYVDLIGLCVLSGQRYYPSRKELVLGGHTEKNNSTLFMHKQVYS